MKTIPYLAIACLLTACAGGGSSPATDAHSPPSPQAKTLSGDEITSQFIGRPHSSVTSTGQPFSETLTPDGKARIRIAGSPEALGSWTLSGNVICVVYPAYGQECSIVKADDQFVWFVDSNKGGTNNRFGR